MVASSKGDLTFELNCARSIGNGQNRNVDDDAGNLAAEEKQ
jgi:hypothetical protein